mmetsp:Transcript_3061/g.8459  ORF Transcript_3061/g.8459 Transcript_3061/m.8459 type:complete len:220 (-) Transcript_3061:570-1229(-)
MLCLRISQIRIVFSKLILSLVRIFPQVRTQLFVKRVHKFSSFQTRELVAPAFVTRVEFICPGTLLARFFSGFKLRPPRSLRLVHSQRREISRPINLLRASCNLFLSESFYKLVYLLLDELRGRVSSKMLARSRGSSFPNRLECLSARLATRCLTRSCHICRQADGGRYGRPERDARLDASNVRGSGKSAFKFRVRGLRREVEQRTLWYGRRTCMQHRGY